jgi:hypothetical protein
MLLDLVQQHGVCASWPVMMVAAGIGMRESSHSHPSIVTQP